MMQRLIGLGLLGLWLSVAPAQAKENGLETVPSTVDAKATVANLEKAIQGRGMKVFTTIDHAAAAADAGLKMPAATVVIFGNPKGGTPNFLKAPTLAIDLPLKMLVWDNQKGKTFITYNTGEYVFGKIFARHGLKPGKKVQAAQEKMLHGLATEAAK